jgi:hypothetical protein
MIQARAMIDSFVECLSHLIPMGCKIWSALLQIMRGVNRYSHPVEPETAQNVAGAM